MLKKYGIKNAESIVRGAIEFNYNRFLELAEPIYVVSRIQSCYTNQREVSMLDKANLEWVGLVVDGGWCGALLPYIEKYGATITKKAIQYLIENKMWDAYDGKTALKTKGANHYKGFEDIHAAAEYVKELEPPKDDTTETAETTKHDGDTEKASDEVSDLSEKAFEASETIKKLLTDAICGMLMVDLLYQNNTHMDEVIAERLGEKRQSIHDPKIDALRSILDAYAGEVGQFDYKNENVELAKNIILRRVNEIEFNITND